MHENDTRGHVDKNYIYFCVACLRIVTARGTLLQLQIDNIFYLADNNHVLIINKKYLNMKCFFHHTDQVIFSLDIIVSYLGGLFDWNNKLVYDRLFR